VPLTFVAAPSIHARVRNQIRRELLRVWADQ
jgi:hypothetical protein